jgi:hypothetical protein
MRCPACEEVVDESTAVRGGGNAYLLCWNGHRFGLDGSPVAVVASVTGTSTAIGWHGASPEDGAIG